MRIAWFTPFASSSAIGRYSRIVAEELSRSAVVEIFAPMPSKGIDFHATDVPVRTIADEPEEGVLRRLAEFDLAVYNLGDHYGNHCAIREYARLRPGVVVLHDLMLRDFWACRAARRDGNHDAFYDLHDLLYPERPGREIKETIYNLDRIRYPMFEPFLVNALGAVVHSKFAEDAIAQVTPLPVARIDFPRDPDFPHATDARRAPGTVRLLTFGHVNPNKLVHAVIECLGENPDLAKLAEYDIVGGIEEPYRDALKDLIGRHRLDGRVHLLGRLSDLELRRRLATSHIAINLRYPHFGESSWSLIEAMFAGLPCVLWDHGYYAEFPNECAAKISSLDELPGVLRSLIRGARRREGMGQAAIEHARKRFQTPLYCQRLLEFADRVRSERHFWSLTGRVGEYLAELYARPEDDWTVRVTDELARLNRDAA